MAVQYVCSCGSWHDTLAFESHNCPDDHGLCNAELEDPWVQCSRFRDHPEEAHYDFDAGKLWTDKGERWDA